jgi:hypothetical protein
VDPVIPLWLKTVYTAFVAVLVPIYWKHWGPRNFLWFSDLALFGTAAALWLESPFLASMLAVAVLFPELVWNVGYFGRLLTGRYMGSLAAYMFDARMPRYVRALSLFHVALPVLLLWLIHTLGYAPNAWIATTLVAWVVLPVTYRLTGREQNVNWVYGPKGVPEHVYLAGVMLAYPILIYLPTHLVLSAVYDR